MTDALLITSPRPHWVSELAFRVSENSCPPLGLLYVAGALQDAGYQVQVEDFYRQGLKPRDVVPLCKRTTPRVVGISCLTSSSHLAARVCRHIKREFPHIVTVLGGPHATAVPIEILTTEEPIDYVVRGEGELTFRELVAAISDGEHRSVERISSIRGIGFRHQGKPVLTEDRPAIEVDEAPLPARHLVDMDRYLQVGAVMASRGCPHRCFFCSSVSFNSHRYRYRSPRAVVEEMDSLNRDFGTVEFEFLDDVLTAAEEPARELFSLLGTRSYSWGCMAMIKDILKSPELLDLMIQSGCAGVFFGMESGNDQVLRKVKGFRTRDVLDIVKRALDLGLQHVITSFMIGHPWDTRQTIEDTFQLMLRLRSLGCHTPLAILVPYPGSELARSPDRFGIRVESSDYSKYCHNRAVLSTPHLDRQELEDIYFDLVCRLTEATGGTSEPVSTDQAIPH